MSKKFEQKIEKEWDKLMWNREYKKGEKLIKKALKIEPNNPKFWYFLGHIYDHMPGKENERKAIECYKKVKSLAPDWVNWRIGMARVYWRKGSLRALRYYREILKSKLESRAATSSYQILGLTTLATSKHALAILISGVKS